MKWKTVLGYKKPQEFEIGVTTVYFRRNIVETKVPQMMGDDTEEVDAWSYEEAQMLLSEYEEYLEVMESPAMSTILEQFKSQEQASEESLLNQAVIMSETEYQTCLMELNSSM